MRSTSQQEATGRVFGGFFSACFGGFSGFLVDFCWVFVGFSGLWGVGN